MTWIGSPALPEKQKQQKLFHELQLGVEHTGMYCSKNQTTSASFSLQVKAQGGAAAGARTPGAPIKGECKFYLPPIE